MAFRDTQNPGIGGLDELTLAEEQAIQVIAALGTAGQVLKTNATEDGLEWGTGGGGGTGDVVGPASAVSDNLATFDGLTGKLIKDSGSKVADFATAGHDHAGVYAPALGADDNYVTDAEKAALHSHSNKTILDNTTASFTTAQETKLSNLSGTNTGDQDLSALAPKASPTFTGTVTLPTGLTGVLRADSGVVSVDPGAGETLGADVSITYNSNGTIATVTDVTATPDIVYTMTYTNGVLSSYTDGTNTWTINYTSGIITGITKT